MKIVVDSNVIYSALLNTGEYVRDIFFSDLYELHSCKYIVVETFRNKEKLFKHAKLKDSILLDRLFKLLRNVTPVNEGFISDDSLERAYELCSGGYEKDIPFVALSIHMNCPLWTNDEELMLNLSNRGFYNFFNP